MSFKKSVISILLLSFCFLSSKAQDNYVYQDSSLVKPDSIAINSIEEKGIGDDSEEKVSDVIPDTTLTNNKLTLEGDSIGVLKNSKPFAYAKNLDSLLKELQKKQQVENNIKPEPPSLLERIFSSRITSVIFWSLAVLFIVFILYRLFFTEGFFQRQYAKSNVIVLPEPEENLLVGADYTKLISQAVINKNYRLAIRYHYLESLQKLTRKGVIEFAADKTNYQYLRELAGKPYKNDFASLTLHYEYVWYGKFDVSETVFAAIQNKFKQFNTQV